MLREVVRRIYTKKIKYGVPVTFHSHDVLDCGHSVKVNEGRNRTVALKRECQQCEDKIETNPSEGS
jgi:hypothetical protein